MSIWVELTGHSDPSKDHSINVIYQFTPSNEFHVAWINPKGRKISFHGVVTDGAIGQVQFPHKAVLYKFHKSEWCKPLLVILQDASSDEMYLSLGSDNQNSSNMQIRTNSCPDKGTRPVLTWSLVYGFIHSRVVHLWDTQNGRVILFDYIANSPYDPITVQVMFVPFREYFVCKRTSDYVDGMLHWIVLVILVILGAAGVGAFYWCYKNRQSRFAKNGSKGKANKSTTLKSQAPSTTASIRLESTRPSSSRISSTKAPFKMETFTDLGKITKTTTTTPKVGGKSLQVKSILNANGEMCQSTAPGLNPFQAFMVSSNVEGLSSAVSGIPKVPNKIQDCAKSRISSSSIASSSGLKK